jgi:hypothetical protein
MVGSGPQIQVEISIPPSLAQHLQSQGLAVPAPVVGLGLIDTGAFASAVDTSVVQQLQIHPIGTMPVHGAGGVNPHMQYPASFRFPTTAFPSINFNFVIGAPLAPQGIIALIGRDVLSHFVLVYNGVFGQYILSL